MSAAAAAASTSSDKSPPPDKDAGTANTEHELQAERHGRALRIVRKNTYWALGVGIIPFPIVDFLGLTAVELKMIKELADTYQVKFTESPAKSIVASLATSVGSLSIAGALTFSLFKLIPAVGQVVGIASLSVIGAAFTQAVGHLFIMHFESGGTLLNFDPVKMRDHFRKEFEEAKSTVSKLQKEDARSKPA